MNFPITSHPLHQQFINRACTHPNHSFWPRTRSNSTKTTTRYPSIPSDSILDAAGPNPTRFFARQTAISIPTAREHLTYPVTSSCKSEFPCLRYPFNLDLLHQRWGRLPSNGGTTTLPSPRHSQQKKSKKKKFAHHLAHLPTKSQPSIMSSSLCLPIDLVARRSSERRIHFLIVPEGGALRLYWITTTPLHAPLLGVACVLLSSMARRQTWLPFLFSSLSIVSTSRTVLDLSFVSILRLFRGLLSFYNVSLQSARPKPLDATFLCRAITM